MEDQKNEPLVLLENVKGDSKDIISVKLHNQNLEKVLAKAEERRVSIVSVIDTFPQGRNFLINFLIRHFKTKEDFEPGQNKSSFREFLWDDEIIPDEQLSATYIFTNPFITLDAQEEEIAVILLYTPSHHRQLTAESVMCPIVGLNFIISSVVVFDCNQSFPNGIISCLNGAIKYGLQEFQQIIPSLPFGELSILIRDWNFATDYPYGEQGGEKYVEMVLSKTGESDSLYETITKYFQGLSCHLLPSPGSHSVSTSFAGIAEELDPSYLQEMQNFVNNLFQDSKLNQPEMFSDGFTKTHIIPFLETYIENINSNLTYNVFMKPDNESETKATSDEDDLVFIKNTESDVQKIYQEAFMVYTNMLQTHKTEKGDTFSSEDELALLHETAVDESRKVLSRKFDQLCSIDETETTHEILQQKLEYDIQQHFEKIHTSDTKPLKMPSDELKFPDLIDRYKTFLLEWHSKSHQNVEKDINQYSKRIMDDLSIELQGRLEENEHPKNFNAEQVSLLETKLREVGAKLIPKRIKEITDKHNSHQKALDEILSLYGGTMAKCLDVENSLVERNDLENSHIQTREICSRKLRIEVGYYNPEAAIHLEYEIDSLYRDDILKKYEGIRQEIKIQTEEICSKMEESYKMEISQIDGFTTSSPEEIKQDHITRVNEIIENFRKLCKYSRDSQKLAEYVKNLTERLNILMKNQLEAQLKHKKEINDKIKEAVEKSSYLYDEQMKAELGLRGFLSDIEVNTCSFDAMEKACEAYMVELKSLDIPIYMAVSEEEFKTKLVKNLDTFKSKNFKKRILALEQTKELTNKCVKIYHDDIMHGMEEITNEEDLKCLHQNALDKAQSCLKRDCGKQNDPLFLLEFLETLNSQIHEAFNQIEAIFKMKISTEFQAGKLAMTKATQFYNEEMEKHFLSNAFIEPADLQILHEKISNNAIEHCLETNPNLSRSKSIELQHGMHTIFEKYKEQNYMNLAHEPAIGIDLGTTYCCVAYYFKGDIHIIRNDVGQNTTPSYVAFDKDDGETFGEAAKSRAYENPAETIFDAKRIIGRRFDDANLQSDMKLWPFTVVDDLGVPKILVHEKKLHPEEISAKLLQTLKQDAERQLNMKVKKAVITVPAYFTEGQRLATEHAGKMADLEVLTILNEPTAAAIAYKLQHSDSTNKRRALIFDLGGGTCDVSVLEMSHGTINILAYAGDTHLGGEDFDKNLMYHCAQEFKKLHSIDLFDKKDSTFKQTKDEARRRLKRLQGVCERIKIELSSSRTAKVCIDTMYDDIDLLVPVTRETFEKLNESLFNKTIKIVDDAIKAAQLEKSSIDDVVLVGGSTRIPKIQNLLKAFFDGKTLDFSINPDVAVAHGAALTAAYKNATVEKTSRDYNKVQDVTPMSIGVEVYGGGFSVIIPRGTHIPVKLEEKYKTAHNNQTSVLISIYQGEKDTATANSHLGDFYLNGIPPKIGEAESVDVEMLITERGILRVSATSSSMNRNFYVVENKWRMSEAELRKYEKQSGKKMVAIVSPRSHTSQS